jgi:hypothetical protein
MAKAQDTFNSIYETMKKTKRRRGESIIRHLDEGQKISLKDALKTVKKNMKNTELDSGGNPGDRTGL